MNMDEKNLVLLQSWYEFFVEELQLDRDSFGGNDTLFKMFVKIANDTKRVLVENGLSESHIVTLDDISKELSE